MPAEFHLKSVAEKKSSQPSLFDVHSVDVGVDDDDRGRLSGDRFDCGVNVNVGTMENSGLPRLCRGWHCCSASLFAVLAVAMLTAIVNLIAMFLTVYTLGLEELVFGEGGTLVFCGPAGDGVAFDLCRVLFCNVVGLHQFCTKLQGSSGVPDSIDVGFVDAGHDQPCAKHGIKHPCWPIVPLVNIVMLSRDLFTGSADLAMGAITVISTLLYGVMALGVCVENLWR